MTGCAVDILLIFIVNVGKKGKKGSSSILIKSLGVGRGSKRRKLNEGSAVEKEEEENDMVMKLIAEKSKEVKEWAAEANARQPQPPPPSKKRGYFDIASHVMPSGHRSEADMSQYLRSTTEFNPGLPALLIQPP